AHELGLGLRQGERRYTLEALLAQDAPAVLGWLSNEASRQREIHRLLQPAWRPVTEHWVSRAEATASELSRLADEALDVTANAAVLLCRTPPCVNSIRRPRSTPGVNMQRPPSRMTADSNFERHRHVIGGTGGAELSELGPRWISERRACVSGRCWRTGQICRRGGFGWALRRKPRNSWPTRAGPRSRPGTRSSGGGDPA